MPAVFNRTFWECGVKRVRLRLGTREVAMGHEPVGSWLHVALHWPVADVFFKIDLIN